MQTLYFDSSSNLKDLIGRRLVTNKISAIFELVKNSFDADALEVVVEFDEENNQLTISDNGDGMTYEDIKNKWMVIGTDNKKGRIYTKSGRPLNGEKGIGRFSADRLGKRLTLISETVNSNKAIKMEFDWEKFEEREEMRLSDIPVEYHYIKSKKEKGVTLIISDLRDEWDDIEISKLEKRLRGLLSPFQETKKDKFSIVLDSKIYGYNKKKLTSYDLGDISSLWIEMEISIDDPKTINYKIYRNGAVIESKDYNNKYNFGPIKLIIYSFDQGDKNSFHNKFKVPVKDFGNIRIYRDSFQIYPYGETGNDWLDIDVRKAQGMFRYLGMRDIIGYLQIYREHNLQFIDATNRQGLEENEALDALKNFVKKEAIPKLEGYFFLKKNKTEEKQHKDNREEIKNATVSLKEIAKKINKTAPEEAKKVLELTKVIQEKNQKQDQIIRNQQQMVEVYKRISSKETLLHGTIHRVLMKNQNVQTAIYNQRDELEQFQIDDEIRKVLEATDYYILNNTKEVKKYLISARKHLLKKREVTIVNVFDQLNRVFRTERATLINKNIAYEIIGPKSITLKIDVNDFNVIFENLISNSRKSLMQVNNRSKKIEVKYEISRNNLNIFFIDNGMGIEKEHIPHIFTPFYTTSNEGFGMGMAIIDELIKSNNGEINVIVPREGEYGAKFQISFKLGG